LNAIFIAAAVVSAIGLLGGLGLAAASKVMAVPTDEKADEIKACLPGASCGVCGYSGCDDYASALSSGGTDDTTLCSPGGRDAAEAIAGVLGVAPADILPKTAVVLCRGNSQNAGDKLRYDGAKSCRMAADVFGGPKKCVQGCIGFGDCARACPNEAIRICEGVARIDPAKCGACRLCVAACPKNLISVVPASGAKAVVLCKSREKGAVTKKQCGAGCTGCGMCVKACGAGAVSIGGFCAEVDFEKCTGCGKCASVCPAGSIFLINKTSNGGIT